MVCLYIRERLNSRLVRRQGDDELRAAAAARSIVVLNSLLDMVSTSMAAMRYLLSNIRYGRSPRLTVACEATR